MENINGFYETKETLVGFNEHDVEYKNINGELLYTEHVKTPIYQSEQVFTEYSERQKLEIQIADLKKKLIDTDYIAIKFAEGEISEQNYESVKQQRRNWRLEINNLESTLLSMV